MNEKDNSLKKLEVVQFIIVHCSDTSSTEVDNAADIHEMHLSFGWHGIGYHKVIKRDGFIENGRPEYWKGAHAYGYNDKSLGVCLIGKKQFTQPQFKSLYVILKNWKLKHPKARIIGHRDTQNTDKSCPNFDVIQWCQERNLS